jgi:hypothetical protein
MSNATQRNSGEIYIGRPAGSFSRRLIYINWELSNSAHTVAGETYATPCSDLHELDSRAQRMQVLAMVVSDTRRVAMYQSVAELEPANSGCTSRRL